MELINHILTIIIAFLGFPIGILLAKISPEEIKTGKKYFKIIQTILLVFILFFLLDFLKLNIFITIIITSFVFLLSFYWSRNKSFLFYLLFPLVIYFSKINLKLFALQASIIFVFGLATGSLVVKVKNKKFISPFKELVKIVLINSIFILLSILALIL